MKKSGRLANLVAIVTGGGSGFGECICQAYTAEGASVVVADSNAASGERVTQALAAAGHEALFCRVDVGKSAEMETLVQRAVAHFGRIDIFVNNAGISHPKQPMLEVTEEFFDRLFEVNVKSIYLSARHCLPVFRRQKSGCFINIGSTAAVRPRPGLVWYNGTKGAVALITKSMAVELGSEKIRVNAINPAIAETPLLTTFMGRDDTPEARAPFLASIPLGRLCKPSDVANAAVFLADPASEYLTGVCLEVDGGRCV
jgi:3-oxoacyl-[acyl-carrier protein] reductase